MRISRFDWDGDAPGALASEIRALAPPLSDVSDAVHAGDYSLVLGVTSMSIVAVATAVFLIDMLYPLLDPRVQLA